MSSQADSEPPGVDRGLAFGKRDLLSAKGEFRGEKVVVGDDQEPIGRKQGQAFPFFGYLVPSQSFGRQIQVVKIEEQAFLYVIDGLVGVKGFEFGISFAERVGLVGKGKQVGSAGEIEDADRFEDGLLGVGGAVLAPVAAFQRQDFSVGQAEEVAENEVLGLQFGAGFAKGGGVGKAHGILGLGGTSKSVDREEAAGAGPAAAILGKGGLEDGVDGFAVR